MFVTAQNWQVEEKPRVIMKQCGNMWN